MRKPTDLPWQHNKAKNMFKRIAALAALIAASSCAFAEPGALYAGIDAGKTEFDGTSQRETSVGAFIGYKIAPNFLGEFAFRRLADANYNGTDFTADHTSLSVIGFLPLNSKFDVYARLGYAEARSRASARGFSARGSDTGGFYGAGISYAFSPAISGRFEFQEPSSDSANLSMGVLFKF